ncbi:hypothetical protein Leryth_019894 [Lithospermum erythrorhizon]|nr:hypothetical protein Leryth_019894 [Lithospermum erythrorhizon]
MEEISKKKLEGKVAIITGGASGVGEVTARLFAKNGVQAVVVADIQDDLGRIVAESIGLRPFAADTTATPDEEQVKNMVDWTVRTYGKLDIMFSNAGILSTSNQDILNLDLSELDHVYSINARGILLVKYAARVMLKGKIKGTMGCTSRLMRCGCKQLGPYGIRVNTVSPWAIATPMLVDYFKDKTVEEAENVYLPCTSLKQALKVEHVADAVLFLASDDSAFITGHDLVVDGGVTA